MTDPATSARVFALTRPHPRLMTYYALRSLALGPLFPLLLIPSWFRYHTMHYRFDEEGVSMGWGILFRREIHLTYTRIQDLHLESNIVERWLGLARIAVQTASGSAQAEMTIEGIREFEELRDFLYSRMRGHSVGSRAAAVATTAPQPSRGPDPADDLAAVLHEVAGELRALRLALDRSGRGRSDHV
jgi:membrane protein YdbS with pleckstrin-like domain